MNISLTTGSVADPGKEEGMSATENDSTNADGTKFLTQLHPLANVHVNEELCSVPFWGTIGRLCICYSICILTFLGEIIFVNLQNVKVISHIIISFICS